jgi:hypothetical protein
MKDGQTNETPDPSIKVVPLVAGLSLQEAHLLAGRIEEAGINVEISSGRSAIGEWTANPVAPVVGSAVGPGLAGNVFGQGTCELLVDERDLEAAKEVADLYLEQ